MFIGKMGNKIRSSLVSQSNLRNLSFFTFVRLFSLSSKGSPKCCQKMGKKQSCSKLPEMARKSIENVF